MIIITVGAGETVGTQGFHWDMSGAPKPFIIHYGSHSPRRECDKGQGHPTSQLSRPVEVLVEGEGTLEQDDEDQLWPGNQWQQ